MLVEHAALCVEVAHGGAAALLKGLEQGHRADTTVIEKRPKLPIAGPVAAPITAPYHGVGRDQHHGKSDITRFHLDKRLSCPIDLSENALGCGGPDEGFRFETNRSNRRRLPGHSQILVCVRINVESQGLALLGIF